MNSPAPEQLSYPQGPIQYEISCYQYMNSHCGKNMIL